MPSAAMASCTLRWVITETSNYLRLLDADADGADWREVARIVLNLHVEKDPERARQVWESHLARAKWMTTNGYRHLLRGGAPHWIDARQART
jgi:hypothetical protein